MVKFSIIIVALNAEHTISETINSTLSQTYSDFEIIIKDGCSKDNTLQMIPQDSRIMVYQEKDNSLYDAMNQATEYAKGEYSIYMNCGDSFAADNVLEVVAEFLEDHKCDLLYGNYIRRHTICKQPKNMSLFYLYRTPLCHQTIFFRTDLLKKNFTYETEYSILADYNIELGMFKAGKSFSHIDISVCSYLGGGISENKHGIAKMKKERKVLLKRYFSSLERIYFGFILALTFPTLRKMLFSEKSPRFIREIYKIFVNKINMK